MFDISWTCKHTWQKASYNTMWCLIGCSIGDFGTIYYFQIIDHSLSIYGDVARNSKWFDYKHYIRNHNSNENIYFC